MRFSNVIVLVVCVLGLVAWATEARAGDITNPSFETGDYTGWVLFEGHPSGAPLAGTWGVVANGTTVNVGDFVFDWNDLVLVEQASGLLPRTFAATDGQYVALQLVTAVQYHRIHQDIVLSSDAKTLSWDMLYDSTGPWPFVGGPEDDPALIGQYLAVVLRDPTDDSLLKELFLTEPGDPLSAGMLSYTADISAYAGTSVRLSVEMDVDWWWFDAAFDNFDLSHGPTASPTATPSGGPAPLSIAFAANALDADGDSLTYLWDFDDLSGSTLANPSHVYTAAGTYVASVTVSDGSHSVTKNVTVLVQPPAALSSESVKVKWKKKNSVKADVKVRADLLAAIPGASDIVSVHLDGVALLSVPFGDFQLDKGVYKLRVKNHHMDLDFALGKVKVHRKKIPLPGFDESNGAVVAIQVGSTVVTETVPLTLKGKKGKKAKKGRELVYKRPKN